MVPTSAPPSVPTELDRRVWPDVASTTPATIMVYGKRLTLPLRGKPINLPGPWTCGYKTVAQRKLETADEFAVRCQEMIDAELVRAGHYPMIDIDRARSRLSQGG